MLECASTHPHSGECLYTIQEKAMFIDKEHEEGVLEHGSLSFVKSLFPDELAKALGGEEPRLEQGDEIALLKSGHLIIHPFRNIQKDDDGKPKKMKVPPTISVIKNNDGWSNGEKQFQTISEVRAWVKEKSEIKDYQPNIKFVSPLFGEACNINDPTCESCQ